MSDFSKSTTIRGCIVGDGVCKLCKKKKHEVVIPLLYTTSPEKYVFLDITLCKECFDKKVSETRVA